MKVRFWGVRGSFPAPGADTLRIGGNTACVSIERDGQVVVLDAGTGIRGLGDSLKGTRSEIILVTSHMHWDHVIGIPSFAPLYEEGRIIRFTLVKSGNRTHSPLDVIDGVHFPRRSRDLPASCDLVEDEAAFFSERGFSFHRLPLNHPGGASGFRIGFGKASFVYMTDNELGGSAEGRSAFAAFARGATLLCHDGQYTEAEIETRRGWGHSSVMEACALAAEAGVEHLLLFHHDPGRTDKQVVGLEAAAREALQPHGIACTAAFEGLELDVE